MECPLCIMFFQPLGVVGSEIIDNFLSEDVYEVLTGFRGFDRTLVRASSLQTLDVVSRLT